MLAPGFPLFSWRHAVEFWINVWSGRGEANRGAGSGRRRALIRPSATAPGEHPQTVAIAVPPESRDEELGPQDRRRHALILGTEGQHDG